MDWNWVDPTWTGLGGGSLVEQAVVRYISERKRVNLQELKAMFGVEPDSDIAQSILEITILKLVADGIVMCDDNVLWLDIPLDPHDHEALEAWLNDR